MVEGHDENLTQFPETIAGWVLRGWRGGEGGNQDDICIIICDSWNATGWMCGRVGRVKVNWMEILLNATASSGKAGDDPLRSA